MIVLPPGFVSTRYAGYFWHIPEKKLYSCKVDGVLKPMKIKKPFRNKKIGYSVSVNGFKRLLPLDYLYGLKYPATTQLFPIKKEKNENQ
jgi:hypothetical protein